MFLYQYWTNGSIPVLDQWFYASTGPIVLYQYWTNGSIPVLDQWFYTSPGPMVLYQYWTSGSIPVLDQWFYTSTGPMVLYQYRSNISTGEVILSENKVNFGICTLYNIQLWLMFTTFYDMYICKFKLDRCNFYIIGYIALVERLTYREILILCQKYLNWEDER